MVHGAYTHQDLGQASTSRIEPVVQDPAQLTSMQSAPRPPPTPSQYPNPPYRQSYTNDMLQSRELGPLELSSTHRSQGGFMQGSHVRLTTPALRQWSNTARPLLQGGGTGSAHFPTSSFSFRGPEHSVTRAHDNPSAGREFPQPTQPSAQASAPVRPSTSHSNTPMAIFLNFVQGGQSQAIPYLLKT
jgi:hypothetical protein